ncbi:hypothetical protein A2U01_0043089, partial [Trifolium medium]|nr:hypothetical protein [Trifolium medium]
NGGLCGGGGNSFDEGGGGFGGESGFDDGDENRGKALSGGFDGGRSELPSSDFDEDGSAGKGEKFCFGDGGGVGVGEKTVSDCDFRSGGSGGGGGTVEKQQSSEFHGDDGCTRKVLSGGLMSLPMLLVLFPFLAEVISNL